MRLLHPTTIKILAQHPEFPKTHLSHAWSEVFKYLASGKKHPKMFLQVEEDYGNYLAYIYHTTKDKGYNFDHNKISKLSNNVMRGWDLYNHWDKDMFSEQFNNNYLFSDACSLYYKGTNIFPDLYGDEWRKYIPVESHKEIVRQCLKTITGKPISEKQIRDII